MSSCPHGGRGPVTRSFPTISVNTALEIASWALGPSPPGCVARPAGLCSPFSGAAFGSAGSSPPSSQNAALPPSSAWPLAASGHSRAFSSLAPAPTVAGTHLASQRAGRLLSLSPNKTDGLAFPGGLSAPLQAGRPHGVMESGPELCRAEMGPRALLTPSLGSGDVDTSCHKDPGVIEAPQHETQYSYCLNVSASPSPPTSPQPSSYDHKTRGI